MTRDELLKALPQMAPMPGSSFCDGCGYEHNCKQQGCAISRAAVMEIKRMREETGWLKQEIYDLLRATMTPQSAADILRNANLGGNLRIAADMGIEALEREMEMQ